MKHIRIATKWFRLEAHEVAPVVKALCKDRPRPIVYFNGKFYLGAKQEGLVVGNRTITADVYPELMRMLNLEVPESQIKVIEIESDA